MRPISGEFKLFDFIFVSQAKCKNFKNPKVFEAFKAICVNEMLLNRNKVPNYDLIIDTLDKAIVQIRKKGEPVQFLWLTDASGSGTS